MLHQFFEYIIILRKVLFLLSRFKFSLSVLNGGKIIFILFLCFNKIRYIILKYNILVCIANNVRCIFIFCKSVLYFHTIIFDSRWLNIIIYYFIPNKKK